MAFLLGDIYIGDDPIIQNFGAKPEVYSARFGIRGHNGIDIGCKSLTPILSAAEGFVLNCGFDAGGYGKFIEIVHNGYSTLYGHLNDILVKKDERVIAGQLIGHSNNTGFSDVPHLHFGVAPCDGTGVKLELDNGYDGFIDPQSSLCEWVVKKLKEPAVTGIEEPQKVTIPNTDFTRLTAQGANYNVITSYLIRTGLNDFLAKDGKATIDLVNNPSDPLAGEQIVGFLIARIEHKEPVVVKGTMKIVQKIPSLPHKGFFFRLREKIKSLIFVPK